MSNEVPDVTKLDELPGDVLEIVCSQLDGQSAFSLRHANSTCATFASAVCKRCTIPVTSSNPSSPMSLSTGRLVTSLDSLRLIVPAIERPTLTRQQRANRTTHCSPLDSHINENALDRFLDEIGSFSFRVNWTSLRIRRSDGNDAMAQSSIGLSALVRIAAACALGPGLRTLSLPYLHPTAATALPFFTSLKKVSLVLADGTCLDHLLQIKTLEHISLMTAEGLLYLILSLDQIERICGLPALRSLSLQNVFLHDCEMTWSSFSNLQKLETLRVSSPMSVSRLLQLPTSLTTLQVPYFSNGGLNPDPLEEARLLLLCSPPSIINPSIIMLKDLRCKQTLTEEDLDTIARFFLVLESITIENIILSQSTLDQIQFSSFAPRGLPCLPSVTSVRMTGHHRHWQVLGLLFPNLQRLEIQSVESPPINTTKSQLLEIKVVPLPFLTHLTWPVGKALPPILLAAPAIKKLTVMSINCAQRLDDVFRLPHPQDRIQADYMGSLPKAKGSSSSLTLDWWPDNLLELELGFCSSTTFRPKTICRAMESAPVKCRTNVIKLTLRDHGPLAILRPKQAMASGVVVSSHHAHDASTSHGPQDDTGRVVDGSVASSALTSFRQLRCLTVIGAKSLDGPGLLQAVGKSSPLLETLTIQGCPRVNKADLLKIPGQTHRPQLNVALSDFALDLF